MRAAPNPCVPSRLARDDAGFTLVEVLVAATLFVIGALATLALLDNGARATGTSLRRDTGNAIAREMIERAQGMQYTILANDLTDVRATDPRTPADRLRAAMDPTPPTGPRHSTDPWIRGTNPHVPIAQATDPWRTTAEWTLRRRDTDYTLSYRACTHSEVANGVRILGPNDCDRTPSTTPPPGPSASAGACSLALTLTAGQLRDRIAANPQDVVVDVQLLNLLGVGACVSGTLDVLDLSNLTKPLCQVLGDGTNALSTVSGLLGSVLGPLASNVSVSLCPTSTSNSTAPGPPPGVATSTDVRVGVSWTDPGSGRTSRIVQTTVVRRTDP